MIVRLFMQSVLSAIAIVSIGAAQAQAYPVKPVRFVVPFPPGGATDALARVLGRSLTESTGQTFVIDNRGGAAGNIAAELVAQSLPDGYSLLLATNTLAINASIYRKLPFDPLKDFAAVSLIATTPNVLAVHPSLPVQNVKQLIALAKARPGKLTYASQGNGGTGHLAGELFKTMAHVDIVHVPYKGAAPALIDLMAGNVDMAIVGVSALAQAKTGKLRALAVSSLKRMPSAPDVPTVAESGLPGYETTTWFGVMAPAQTPQPIVFVLHQHIAKALAAPAVSQTLAAQGFELAQGSASEFSAFYAKELVKWREVIKASGAKVE
jgi:tripartite-type tricarboxylate transporter receptor subunit TctC